MKGKGKMFAGKESMAEEMAEAKAVKSGKISPKQYAMREKAEEGKGMKCGGKVKKMAKGSSKGYASGGAVKGAGMTMKGLKPCKMR